MTAARSPDLPPSEPESQHPNPEATADEGPARHTIRRRTVERFLSRPNVPEGAIPAAIRKVIGGPMMWSERPIRETQFTPEQQDLLLRAADEIRTLYLRAGGSMDPPMLETDALGLMPDNASRYPYQSEEWAAAKAINAGLAFPYREDLPEPERTRAALTQAYYIVITWIDYVKGGLLDASEIYENDDDDDEPPVSGIPSE
ncbi:MAG TPA: hypothetical protein VEU28_06390 [Actinomycetota bacterium]|nr:hypothetical protein [Actinomycetota bacterium]